MCVDGPPPAWPAEMGNWLLLHKSWPAGRSSKLGVETWGQVPVIDLGLLIALAPFSVQATYWRTNFWRFIYIFFALFAFILESISEKCMEVHFGKKILEEVFF